MTSRWQWSLQVDALAGGVGGEQDPDGRLGRVLVELRADQLAGLGVGAAVDDRDAVLLVALAGAGSSRIQVSVSTYSVKTTTRSLRQSPSGAAGPSR